MGIAARLELGETETTSYIDPRTMEEVKVRFRHATKGELGGSMVEAGLDIDEDGNLIDLKGELEGRRRVEDADIRLARKCVLEPKDTGAMYHPALAYIGEYLREHAQLVKDEETDEGELSGPPASGPTSAPSAKG